MQTRGQVAKQYPLHNCCVALCGSFPGYNHPELQKELRSLGADTASSVNKNTTHLITIQTHHDRPSAKVNAAKKLGIPIVKVEWLLDSVSSWSREPENSYLFGSASPTPTGQAACQATQGQTTSSRKRAAPPVGDASVNAPKAKKKRQVDNDSIDATDADNKAADSKVADAKAKAKVEAVVGEGPVATSRDLRIPLDDGCPFISYEVYIGDDGVIYDASLNQTNATNNNNKFYRIQLLHDGKGDYKTWTRWGRVGERGQSASFGNGSLEGAILVFEKKFRDKSGLSWASRCSDPKPGKYAFVERSYDADSDEEEDDTAANKGKKKANAWTPPSSSLDPTVQQLMALIFNHNLFAAAMNAMNYDAEKLPLGKLSRATITRGFQALKDLSALLDDNSLAGNYGLTVPAAIEQLSNSFYSLIPHAFGRSRPPIIQYQRMVKKEIELLESLSDMKDAALIMRMEKVGETEIHPLDKQYQGLGMKEMTPLDPDTPEFQNLADYLVNTRGATHNANYRIEAIFRIERDGERARFDQSQYASIAQDRRLLWHGSRCTNFGGILSQGLRIAPPEAPVNGYMFGKGIYLADMSSKSANYCAAEISNHTGLLLLCEAELGNPKQKLVRASYSAGETAKIKGMISTFGQGRTGPKVWKDAECVHPSLKGVKMPDTTTAPGDTGVTSGSLEYNEYICYDIAQVRLRYLFRVKMGGGD